MKRATIRLFVLYSLMLLILPTRSLAAGNREVLLQPPEGYFFFSGRRVFFSGDRKTVFVAVRKRSFQLGIKILSFSAETGAPISELEVPEFDDFHRASIDTQNHRIVLVGQRFTFLTFSRVELLLVSYDDDGRLLRVDALPVGIEYPFDSAGVNDPLFFNDGRTVLYGDWALNLAKPREARSYLQTFDTSSRSLQDEYDLESFKPRLLLLVASNPQTSRIAVVMSTVVFFPPVISDDLVAFFTIGADGKIRLERVVEPKKGFLGGITFDPAGNFLFTVTSSKKAEVFSIEFDTGEISPTQPLGFEVSGTRVPLNASRNLFGVTGLESLAFQNFAPDGGLGEAVGVRSNAPLSFFFTNFEFFPDGYRAASLEWSRKVLLLIDTQSGVILHEVPIRFTVPLSVGPDGTVVVIDEEVVVNGQAEKNAIHLYKFDLSPEIVFTEARKRKLKVFGLRILKGARVEINGEPVVAILDRDQTQFTVKASLAKGQTVMVEIVNPDGSRSGKVAVTR